MVVYSTCNRCPGRLPGPALRCPKCGNSAVVFHSHPAGTPCEMDAKAKVAA